ncbi:hypothetical protein CLV81_2296 [Flagellimonas meridianipacifica]|uniref:Uncharacterized protein n=1 Tax=Flagellimonas meridianipacifica TaxID=1080225 RepID=A0A2T0M8V4_9FLAO|nr:hypothetical protein CLV81_2296 [Allomuricauda pacifica]
MFTITGAGAVALAGVGTTLGYGTDGAGTTGAGAAALAGVGTTHGYGTAGAGVAASVGAGAVALAGIGLDLVMLDFMALTMEEVSMDVVSIEALLSTEPEEDMPQELFREPHYVLVGLI